MKSIRDKKILIAMLSTASTLLSGCALKDKAEELEDQAKDAALEYIISHMMEYEDSLSNNAVSDNTISDNSASVTEVEHPAPLDEDSLDYNAFQYDYAECINESWIYKEPKENDNYYTNFAVGRQLKIQDEYDDKWFLVDYYGRTAYVKKADVQVVTKEEIILPIINKGYVENGSKMYLDKDEQHEINGLHTLEFVEIYKEYEDTYLVQTIDGVGFVPKEDVTIIEGNMAVVDISNQELRLYKDNELYYSAAVTTGNVEQGTDSDEGLFHVWGKYRSFYMTPTAWVDYCLYYNQACEAIHNAPWRKIFGGTVYLQKGSHGCTNADDETAEVSYELLDEGAPVLVKH